jgi:transposase-like protein
MGKQVKYSLEVRERAVRLFEAHVHEHPSRWAAMQSIAGKIGCTTQTLSTWVSRAEAAADLQATADRPVDVLRAQGAPDRSTAGAGAGATGCGAIAVDTPGLGGELPRLRRTRGMETAAT